MPKIKSSPSEDSTVAKLRAQSKAETLNIPTELITFHDLIEKMSNVDMDDEGYFGDQVSADEKLKHLLREHANSLDEAARKKLEEKVELYEKTVKDEQTAKQAYTKEQNALSGNLHGPLTKALGALQGALIELGDMPADRDINKHPAVVAYANLQEYTELKKKTERYEALEAEFGKLDTESSTADNERLKVIETRIAEIEADEDYTKGRQNLKALEALKNADGEQYTEEDARDAEKIYSQLEKLYRHIGKIRSLGGQTSADASEQKAIQDYKDKFTGELSILFDATGLPSSLDFSRDEMSLQNLKRTINIVATHPLFTGLGEIMEQMDGLELSDEETMEKIENLRASSEQKEADRKKLEQELKKIAEDADIDLDQEEASLADEYSEISDKANTEIDKRTEALRREVSSNIQTIASNIGVFESKAIEELEKTATYHLLYPFLVSLLEDEEKDYIFFPPKEVANAFREFGKKKEELAKVMGYEAGESMAHEHSSKAKQIVSRTADLIEKSDHTAGMDEVTDLQDELDPRLSQRKEYMRSKDNTLNAVKNLNTQASNILRMANFLRTMMDDLDNSLRLNGKDIETEEQNIRDIQKTIDNQLRAKRIALKKLQLQKHRPGANLDKDLQNQISTLEAEVISLEDIARDEGKPHPLRANKVKYERRRKNYIDQRVSIEQARSLVANFMVKIMLNLANNQNDQLPHLARIDHLSQDLESFKKFEETRPSKDDEPTYTFKPQYTMGEELIELESSVTIKEKTDEENDAAVDASQLVRSLYLYKILEGEDPVRVESFA